MLLIESEVKFEQDVTAAGGEKGLALSLFRVFGNDRPSAYGGALWTSPTGMPVDHPKVLQPTPTTIPAGGYVALASHPFGVPAVFALEPARFRIYEAFHTPQITVGPEIQQRIFKAGERIDRRYLFVLTAGGARDRQLLAHIRDVYGFDGQPAYRLTMKRGRLLDAVYAPRLKADGCGVVCAISKADLPAPLGLRVEGLNGNWGAGVYDLEANRLVKRVAIYRGVGYLALDIAHARRVFIGNLVVADDPALIINVLSLGHEGGRVVVHNPTDKRLKARITLAGGLPDVPRLRAQVDLAPGTDETIAWP